MLESYIALLRYSQLIPRSPPALSPVLTRRPGLRKRAHPFTIHLTDDKQCIPPSPIYSLASSCPVLGLFFHRFFFIPYTLSTTIISISRSLHLVLLALLNSCELQIIILY